MNPELTDLVMMSSVGSGEAKGWKEKPGLEGWRGEVGEVEEWRTWIILWWDGEEEMSLR